MKAIILNKIYDTDKAELIFSYIKNDQKNTILGPNLKFNFWRDVDIYKTNKGNYFEHIHKGDTDGKSQYLEEKIELVSENTVKHIIMKLNPDKYIELYGEIEEG